MLHNNNNSISVQLAFFSYIFSVPFFFQEMYSDVLLATPAVCLEFWQIVSNILLIRLRGFRLIVFYYFIQIIRYMFRSYDNLQAEICTSEINTIETKVR
jgi:hypothetical protein